MALPVTQILAQIQEGMSDVVVAEAEEKADEAVEMMEEAEDMVATSATCSFSIFELASHAPWTENANINVKIIGASQEMCSYLPLLQKLPAALVIRKVKVTKHSSRVSLREIFTWKGLKRLTEPLRNISGWVFSFKGLLLLRTTLCAFSSFGKGKITAHNVGTKIGLIGHIYLAFSAGVGFWSQDICWIWICTDIWLL